VGKGKRTGASEAGVKPDRGREEGTKENDKDWGGLLPVPSRTGGEGHSGKKNKRKMSGKKLAKNLDLSTKRQLRRMGGRKIGKKQTRQRGSLPSILQWGAVRSPEGRQMVHRRRPACDLLTHGGKARRRVERLQKPLSTSHAPGQPKANPLAREDATYCRKGAE